MIRCYHCGREVQTHLVVRRNVRTGSAFDTHGNYVAVNGRVDLCPQCDRKYEQAARDGNNFLLTFLTVGGGILAAFVLLVVAVCAFMILGALFGAK